jgi:hypothetical protein
LAGGSLPSWPFKSVIFVADGEASAALAGEGLPVVGVLRAMLIGVDGLLDHPDAATSQATGDQGIGLQVQPLWGRCGSATAFANQLDCLIDQGLFTIRVFIDHKQPLGDTTLRQLTRLIPENTVDAAAHFEAYASADRYAAPDTEGEADVFEDSVRLRTQSRIRDSIGADLARRASVAIVNRATNLGFAASACPEARIVLDTRDYMTRNAFDIACAEENGRAFPDRSSLRRHVALENRLWQAADVCINVSCDEQRRICRHASSSLLVLPEPYVKPWTDPGPDAEWDMLIVADEHFFNVTSVAWLMEDVISPNERLRNKRVAIVGHVRRSLEHLWSERLPNVRWLGFVDDLDQIRNSSRLAVCPDLSGTGISVKTLTAITAGQPLIATPAAMRGLPRTATAPVPVNDSAPAMAADILNCLENADALRERQELVMRVSHDFRRTNSYVTALARAVRGRLQPPRRAGRF